MEDAVSGTAYTSIQVTNSGTNMETDDLNEVGSVYMNFRIWPIQSGRVIWRRSLIKVKLIEHVLSFPLCILQYGDTLQMLIEYVLPFPLCILQYGDTR